MWNGIYRNNNYPRSKSRVFDPVSLRYFDIENYIGPTTGKPIRVGLHDGEYAMLANGDLQLIQRWDDMKMADKLSRACMFPHCCGEHMRYSNFEECAKRNGCKLPMRRDDGTPAKVGDTVRIENDQIHFEPPPKETAMTDHDSNEAATLYDKLLNEKERRPVPIREWLTREVMFKSPRNAIALLGTDKNMGPFLVSDVFDRDGTCFIRLLQYPGFAFMPNVFDLLSPLPPKFKHTDLVFEIGHPGKYFTVDYISSAYPTMFSFIERPGELFKMDRFEHAPKKPYVAPTLTKATIQAPAINAITKFDVATFKDYDGPGPRFDLYQSIALKSAIYPGQNTPVGLVYVSLKLNGEAGEFAEHVGKAMRDDKLIADIGGQIPEHDYCLPMCTTVQFAHLTAERRTALLKELGDQLWYIGAAAKELGAKLSDVALINLEKLADRTERDKLQGSGDDR